MRRGRRYRQKQCQHLHAEGIYGDEIIYRRKRGYCPECCLFLDALPVQLDLTEASDLL